MNIQRIYKFLSVLTLMIFVSACSVPAAASTAAQTPIIAESVAAIVARYRQEIAQQMQQENIPGLAIAVVDDQGILWAEGFGYTDWDRRTPVTPSTLFSIQSMSKSFTATAAMFAAQDGLVDLDAPITTYLPDFRVNSIFEEHPEQKITLRMLLSHTAGFAHEAPYGNNYDLRRYSFEKHVASISDTWLKFPVGTLYGYSNLGVDLAGYILQVRSGMPFTQYVREQVLGTLGMAHTTLDVRQVRATPDRAIGQIPVPLRPQVGFLIIPSGGVWTTAEDMARYLQFHINAGARDGQRLLREDLAETMYTPPNVPARRAGYALGITVTTRNGARHFQHGGGGFGFNNSMVWYPELKLGAVVLTNGDNGDWCVRLSEDVLDSLIDSNPSLYTQRAVDAVRAEPAYPPSQEAAGLSVRRLNTLIASKALPADQAALERREAFAGTYVFTCWGIPTGTGEVKAQNGGLYHTFFGQPVPLIEVEPGLFFSPVGDTFDVRGPVPTMLNVRLYKANTRALPFQIAFYATCGLVFLSSVFFWPVRFGIRRIRSKGTRASASGAGSQRSRWLLWTGILAALASVISLFCLAIVALVPNLVYVPWPRPYADLLWWQFAGMSLPFAGLLLAVVVALLVGLATRSRTWGRATRGYYIVVALVLFAFNLVLLV